MKNQKINPIGLKGKEISNRMIELMGIKQINENKTNSVVELTKIGPDGKAYAIIRENHKYFIKVSDKKNNLIAEDFKYIGGLQNKQTEAYSSYANAIKHLNLNFKSLAEAYGVGGDINAFQNDNLLSESGVAGFSSPTGNGFSGVGNLEGNTIQEYNSYDDEPYYDDVDSKNHDNRWDKDDSEENEDDDAEDMTEAELAIDAVLKENSGKKLSILYAMENMDKIIDSMELKKKVD